MARITLPRLNLRRMATIVRKELLVLLCNKVSRMLIIVPPLMQIVVFGWAATMEVRNVDVAVLNQDSGNWSREIVRRLQGSHTFRSVTFLDGEADIRPTIEQQKALFVMVFDDEFSRRIEAGTPAQMQVILDGRRSNAAQIASSILKPLCAVLGNPRHGGKWRSALQLTQAARQSWMCACAAGSTPIWNFSGSSCPILLVCWALCWGWW